MTDPIETTTENARAQWHYPPLHVGVLPSEADELQLKLSDRLHRAARLHALQAIADLGRVFDAEDAEPAIEEFGQLLVHASLMAGCYRMAIAPIIALGRALTKDSAISSELPLKPAAALAAAVLKGEPIDIVRGLAMAIAKALDDCEIVHELKIDPLELFKVAAREMLEGKSASASAVLAVQPVAPDKATLRAEAWAQLRQASEVVVADEQTEAATPEQHVSVEHWFKTEFPIGPSVSHAELDAAALRIGPPGSMFERAILPDPGNPGGQGAFGEHSWPRNHRWETDEELRVRIKTALSSPDGKLPACHEPKK
ncbi:MAG TPA: hypothetical protein VLN57_20995 [Xanthobacteraceae bacterium]|nr:hypothetical protein [Xanthobacteraceae bacterium]